MCSCACRLVRLALHVLLCTATCHDSTIPTPVAFLNGKGLFWAGPAHANDAKPTLNT